MNREELEELLKMIEMIAEPKEGQTFLQGLMNERLARSAMFSLQEKCASSLWQESVEHKGKNEK
ncbi:hypothetical protein LCGC14_0456710 [marine sediment metagenome]|uniref:Uncharacterized protein n=1 Tax=marine sediment metagenome TaxID=412755 RepID=A0A0F9SLI4_9ZZZZ